ncbi:integrin alpha-9-like [Vanessa cardui]|uniref:integrin alpha-9-like n=1 Tax=Vanessa cardui TaxID=171605 RepID=UPI001F12C2FD|nr:integrin alpha-9-like [Vanessa cardui]
MKGNRLPFHIEYLLVILIFLRIEYIDGSVFFHEASYLELRSPDAKTDFGFSIAYQAKLNSLAIGAPHADLNGKLFKCPISAAVKNKKLICSHLEINIDKLAGDYSRHNSTDQNFCLGASISATPDYIFTCAPLWTSDIQDGNKLKFGALGTCFISNDTHANRYTGLLEQYVKKDYERRIPKIEEIYGGIGWNTLYDPNNNLILIAKSSLKSSISVMHMGDPLAPTSAVLLGSTFNQYENLGLNFAVGVFFNNHKVLYAFNMILRSRLTGAIAFLYYEGSDKTMKILENKRQPVQIEDNLTNSMYGTSLHSVDLNGDSFSELLVGAPAQTIYEGGYEHGAVFIYLGGGRPTSKTSSNLCICGHKDASRFGTAIASNDIDGDSLPEIFISAPYEDYGEGAVYILSGYEVTRMLLKTGSNPVISVSELSDTQRIKNTPFKSFGFSLHSIRDFDKNGASVLAVGSPKNGTVVLYRSLHFINVTVSALLIGKERVKEDDMNFTVTVFVNVTFPVKPNVLSGRLFVTTNIIGDAARIVDKTYEIKVTKKVSLYTNEVLVLLDDTEPGNYKFTAKVESDVKALEAPEFERSLFTISNYSKPETVLDVVRRCKGNDCVPRLSMHFEWLGSTDEVYILGSSAFENMNVIVRNDGNATYESCAWIKIDGVKASVLGCIQFDDEWYKCDLINIERHGERPINIRLDMSKTTSRDEGLEVEVLLYNNCAATGINATVRQTKKIPFELNTADISIDYLHYDRNITEREIQDVDTSSVIGIRDSFSITNNGSVVWKSVQALITLEKRPFIKNHTIMMLEASECIEDNLDDLTIFNCTLTLEANSTFKISTMTNILKEKMIENFKDGKLSVTSTYIVYLKPTQQTLNKTLISTLYIQEDTSFGNNKNLIIAVAIIVGLLVLAVILLILYKVGFFKRKQKTKLNALKEEIRQKSIRRPNPDDGATSSHEDTQADIEIIEDAIPMQLRNFEVTNDSEVLIKE